MCHKIILSVRIDYANQKTSIWRIFFMTLTMTNQEIFILDATVRESHMVHVEILVK